MIKFSSKINKTLFFSVSSIVSLGFIKKYANGKKAKNIKRMDGKVIIVTGSSAGIGKETAIELLKQGATVVFASRNTTKTMSILENFKDKELKNNAHIIPLDLSDIDSITEFNNKFKQNFTKLDILINNAGVWNNKYSLTKDGIENTLGTNHIGPMILTNYLLDTIHSSHGRIINIASRAHTRSNINFDKIKKLPEIEPNQDSVKYSSLAAYNDSKLANIYFSNHLADYLQRNNIDVKVASLHPGVVLSEIFRNTHKIFQFMAYPLAYLFMKTTYYGAQTTLHLCYLEDEEFISGGYYSECKLEKISSNAKDIDKRNIYMDYSRRLINKVYSNKIELKF